MLPILVVLLALMGCSTRDRRPKPLTIEKCGDVWRKALTRDQFFESLRGRAIVYGKNFSVDLALAMIFPTHARIEVEGALGLRLALLQINDKDVTLYVPREKTAYRFPTSELNRNTARRARFLRLLPMPVYPEVFFEALLTMSQLGFGNDNQELPLCRYDEERNAYLFRIKEGEGGKWVGIDPTRYAPVFSYHFDRHLPKSTELENSRPRFELRFSDFIGEGASSIPRQIAFYRLGKRDFLFEWKEAESWREATKEIMNWQPSASIRVKDY